MLFACAYRRLSALGAALGLLVVLGRAQVLQPEVSGKKSESNYETKETIVRGDAKIIYGDTVLTADEIRYSAATNLVTATGHFVLTYGKRRVVADDGSFNLATKAIHVHNLRLGEFPVYLSGDTVDGTLDEMVFTNATVFFRENAGYTPSIHAKSLTYARGKILKAEGLSVGLLSGHFITFPHFQQALDSAVISYLSAKVGYRGNLGVFAELGLHLPVAPGVQLGADAGLYSSRGIMIGPSGHYHQTTADSSVDGFFRSGYIYDTGDRQNDILGNPVPRNRSYLEWQHQQQIGDHFTLAGQLNYWSDSEILRDFRHQEFYAVQQPDSFLEAAYTGDNYSLSAFTRVNPNTYFRMPERLPELRYDLMPDALPLGVYQRFNSSAAVLEAPAFGTTPSYRTDRLDAYYGLERPFTPVPWFNFTPVVGGRMTYYDNATGGRDTYTRTFGEVGFDAHLLSSGTFDYKNPVWEVDGLRHLFEPKLSYRYAPEADKGHQYIPPIDTEAFSTYLQPLSIADSRNIDTLSSLNTLRLQFNNTLQTRDSTYGSRNLAELNFAADYRFNETVGQKALSDIYTEFALTPAPWLRWEVFNRFDPHTPKQQEFNTGLEIFDQEWWKLKFATHYLRDNYQEYYLEYRQRLNEVYDATVLLRYDALNRRFNEQSYGISQRLGQTWAVRYEVSFYRGQTREGAFALNVEVELLKF